MNAQFKVGDVVTCINDTDSENKLVYGKRYTVTAVNSLFLSIGSKHEEWFQSRFSYLSLQNEQDCNKALKIMEL